MFLLHVYNNQKSTADFEIYYFVWKSTIPHSLAASDCMFGNDLENEIFYFHEIEGAHKAVPGNFLNKIWKTNTPL